MGNIEMIRTEQQNTDMIDRYYKYSIGILIFSS